MELTEPEGDFSGGPEAYDSELPVKGAQVQFLIRKLLIDPIYYN